MCIRDRLWRIVVMRDDRYEEGFVSLFDAGRAPRFDAFDRGTGLYAETRGIPAVARMNRFTHGFFRMAEQDGRITLTDLRMGQEPDYSFSFVVAERSANPGLHALVPYKLNELRRSDLRASLRWLARRALGADEAPPRPAPTDRLNSNASHPPTQDIRPWPSTASASAFQPSTQAHGSPRRPT